MSVKWKEYSFEEFDGKLVYGLDAIVGGQPYANCIETCKRPFNVSKRASESGNNMMEEYYKRCLFAAKKFSHK